MKKITKKQQAKIKKVAQKRADYTKARDLKKKIASQTHPKTED